MSDSSSRRPQAGVGNTHYPFSMPGDSRAPVTKPPSMFCYVDEQSAVELGKSIVLTVALPAFAAGCVVGMLL